MRPFGSFASRKSVRRALPVIESLESRQVLSSFEISGSLPVGPSPQLAAVGHYRRDGATLPFIAATFAPEGGTGGIRVALGDGRGAYTAGAPQLLDGSSPEGIVAGRFTDSGVDDLAVADFNHRLLILRGDGGGGFQVERTIRLPKATPTYLAASVAEGSTYLFLSDYGLRSDFTLRPMGGRVFVFKTNPAGKLRPTAVLHGVQEPNQIVAEDFNGDGKLDLAVANKHKSFVALFRGRGHGRFVDRAIRVRLAPTSGNETGAVGLTAADLDRDGRFDLAVAEFSDTSESGGYVHLLRDISTRRRFGFVDEARVPVQGRRLINIQAVDLGEPGPGLAVTSDDAGAIVVLHRNGPFDYGNAETIPVGNGPGGLLALDLADGDVHDPVDLLATVADHGGELLLAVGKSRRKAVDSSSPRA